MCLSFLTHFFTGVILKIYMEIESNSSSLLETIDIQDCTLLSIQNEFNVTVDDSLDDFETIDYYFFYTDEQYQVLVFLRSLKAGFSSIFDGIYSRNFSIPYSAPPFFLEEFCADLSTLYRDLELYPHTSQDRILILDFFKWILSSLSKQLIYPLITSEECMDIIENTYDEEFLILCTQIFILDKEKNIFEDTDSTINLYKCIFNISLARIP